MYNNMHIHFPLIFKGPRRALQNTQEMEVFVPAGWDDLPSSPQAEAKQHKEAYLISLESDVSGSFETCAIFDQLRPERWISFRDSDHFGP